MKHLCTMAVVVSAASVGASTGSADTLLTHRIPAALAVEAASETVAACAKQGYHETAVVLDADGATRAFTIGTAVIAALSCFAFTRRMGAFLSFSHFGPPKSMDSPEAQKLTHSFGRVKNLSGVSQVLAVMRVTAWRNNDDNR